MKIVVLVKRVPDTETKVKVFGDGKHLDPAGVNYILNPYDEFAIEEALLVKEKHGAGEVMVISVGSKDAIKEMRTALAMGADSGILFEATPSFPDIAATAAALAPKLKELQPDLVLLGKQAVDDDNAGFAQYLAEKLDMGCATVVVKLDIAGREVSAEREIEGGRETVKLSLPAVISCQKGLNTPRYASMKGIMMAKKKPIEEKTLDLGEALTMTSAMTLPPPRPSGRIVGEGPDAVEALIKALRDEAKVI